MSFVLRFLSPRYQFGVRTATSILDLITKAGELREPALTNVARLGGGSSQSFIETMTNNILSQGENGLICPDSVRSLIANPFVVAELCGRFKPSLVKVVSAISELSDVKEQDELLKILVDNPRIAKALGKDSKTTSQVAHLFANTASWLDR